MFTVLKNSNQTQGSKTKNTVVISYAKRQGGPDGEGIKWQQTRIIRKIKKGVKMSGKNVMPDIGRTTEANTPGMPGGITPCSKFVTPGGVKINRAK